MEARIIKTKGKDIVEDISVNFDKTDYEILNRMWARSDGICIREWTPCEYITQNPKEKIILKAQIGEHWINVEAHCVEIRVVYARNKKGQRLISFLYSFDYSKENDADAGTIGASIKQIE